MSTTPSATWRKSRRSDGAGNCVEVAYTPTRIHMRDSKNPTGPVLSFTPQAWAVFLSALRTNTLT